MQLSRRRMVLGALLLIGIILSSLIGRLAWEMTQALNDVNAMIVPEVQLPPTANTIQSDTQEQGSTTTKSVNGILPTAQRTDIPTALPAPDEPVSILLLGTDTRAGQQSIRTDAMILLIYDPKNATASLLPFPRDLWVEIPGYGENRINAAYQIGESKLGPGYGGALAKETVANIMGFPINHFVLIDFNGFKKVIDLLGGISVDVPKAIDDPRYPTDDYSTIALHFDAGVQSLDGERALQYARTRHADSDFGRNQRQQQVLMAIFQRIREQGLFNQLTKINDYTSAMRDYIRTDITSPEMLSLAKSASSLRQDDILRFAIGSDMIYGLEQPATFAVDPEDMRHLADEMTKGKGK